ncbi:MAG: DNA-3-methyladenine glycosylase 2 family protein [Actinomycetota bacterium]|nr:DNA-3-methyladenine glycosylase 2 family protein [Actinomycetota bacterium]
MTRFKVAEDSMRPALSPGQEILATDSRRPVVGEMVVFPHPIRDDFWMVKRSAAPPEPLGSGQIWVLSDNADATMADSRTLGPIEVETAMTVVEYLDAATFAEACAMLGEEDESLAQAIDSHGVPDFWNRSPGFACLTLLILEQQVSLESGAAVYRRLSDAARGVTPETIAALGLDGMRSAGTTRQKAGYLMGLAEKELSGEFDTDALGDEPWPVARERLLSLKGIGPWTADAYLLSALRIPDMWPVGDRALQVGAAEVVGLSSIPDEEELEIIAEPWRPARAVAARVIWHSYLSVRGRVEPPNPTEHRPIESA